MKKRCATLQWLFWSLQKNYHSKKVKDEKKEGVTINSLKELIMGIKNQNQLKKRLRRKKPDEIQKPVWIKLNKNDCD